MTKGGTHTFKTSVKISDFPLFNDIWQLSMQLKKKKFIQDISLTFNSTYL